MADLNAMYNSLLDEVERVLFEIRDEIKMEMAAKGINASGRTSDNIRVERYEGGVRLVIAPGNVAPLGTLEVGRSKGDVPRGFTDILEQWSRDKGLQFASETERRSFAYLLGRRIAREGTNRHWQPENVYSAAVQRGLQKLRHDVKANVTQYLHDNLIP